MKTLIISAIFAVLCSQSAYAAGDLHCQYKGRDGGGASLDFKGQELSGAGVATVVMIDGSTLDFPVQATINVGDLEGELALVITWSSFYDNMTSALIGDGEVLNGAVYSIVSFDSKGPKAVVKGAMTCTSSPYISQLKRK